MKTTIIITIQTDFEEEGRAPDIYTHSYEMKSSFTTCEVCHAMYLDRNDPVCICGAPLVYTVEDEPVK